MWNYWVYDMHIPGALATGYHTVFTMVPAGYEGRGWVECLQLRREEASVWIGAHVC